MGLALDLHINKNGTRTRELSDMEFIRKKIIENPSPNYYKDKRI